MKSQSKRDGFALLIALWIIVTLGTVVAVMSLSARALLERVQRDHDRTVGRWFAEGCVADFRAILDDSLAQPSDRAAASWRAADSLVKTPRGGCDLSLRPDGRVVLDRADERTLDSLPGMTLEAVAMILEMQRLRLPINDLRDVEARLSPAARVPMDLNFTNLMRLSTTVPDRWVILSRSHLGMPAEPTLLEVTITRASGHAALVRWVER